MEKHIAARSKNEMESNDLARIRAQKEHAQFFYDLEWRRSDSLAKKAGMIITANGVFMAASSFLFGELIPTTINWLIVALPILCFILSLFSAISALILLKYDLPSKPDEFNAWANDKTEYDAVKKSLDDYTLCSNTFLDNNNETVKKLLNSLLTFVAGGILLALLIFSAVVGYV